VPATPAHDAPPVSDATASPPLPAEIDRRLREVVSDVLGVDPAALDDGFGRADAPRWDSLNHLRLISSLERALGLRFTMAEVRSMERLGEIRRAVASCL
jgi:acyl carrier protein